ncbi:MAG: FecR domain-containing protein [Deltaproteobacteria bacterium]|nr:FecR domain-containing protein [Deltaproteobacteria bacterium]
MTRALVIAVTAALATHAAAGDAAAKPKVRTYTVQPGDSIWSIAEEFYGSGDKYHVVYKHNTFIGLPPFILKPGQVLTLPEGEQVPAAQVEWLQREVKAKPPRSLDWLSASTDMNLWKLYQVSTGDESAVHIVFEDQSDLRLGDNALLVIYGGSSRRAKKKEEEKTQVLLKEGTVRGGISALDKKPMVVETPSGVVELQAKLAQIQADALAAIVSVYEGQAEVKSEGQVVKVDKGHGTVVEKGKPPEKPRPLPPPPGWALAGGTAVAIVPEGGRASFEAMWTRVEQAKAYRVELGLDEAFTRVPVNVVVGAETTRFKLDQIPAGSYFARIAARDARGLEGMPSTSLRIDVVALRASRRLVLDEASGRWQVAGLVRLDLGDAAPGLEWGVNGGAWVPGSEPQRVQDPGAQEVRVRRLDEALVTSFVFDALDVQGAIDLGGRAPIKAGGDARTITLEVKDERGRPAAVPDLALNANPGGPLTLTEAGPGRWTAALPAPAPPGPETIALTATWADGTLAAATVQVDQLLPDMPYVYHWGDAWRGLPWDGRAAPTPLPSVRAIDRVATEAGIVARDDTTFLGLTLVGELGLLGGDLAIDGALTLFRPPLSSDASQLNDVGDAILGVRGVAWGDRRTQLAPSLRLRMPLKERDGERLFGFEPTVLIRHRAARIVWLETRQGVFAAIGEGGDAAWASDYSVLVRPFDLLSLGAQLSTAFSFGAADEVASLALALGGQLHFDRVRLGLQLGFGLGAGGQARFGEVGGALTLDLGLGTP